MNTGNGFTLLTNGVVYSGATTGTLTITDATSNFNGYEYEAVFTNSAGALTSNAATLTVNLAPTVTTQPSATLAQAGGNAVFIAAATGSPTPTVQWMVNTGTGSGFTNVTDGPITNGGSYSGAKRPHADDHRRDRRHQRLHLRGPYSPTAPARPRATPPR